jgi:type IV secretory pathway component VirB8
MEYVPLYLTALFNSLLLAIGNTFPAVRARRAMSTLWATLIVAAIIIFGIALIYVIVIVPPPY